MPRPSVLDLHSVHGGEVFEAARELEVDPREILDFSSNVNPFGPPKRAVEALRGALWTIPRYPDRTYLELREAAAEYSGAGSAENVVEGNGSTELIYLFAERFVGKGDKVLIPTPSFGEYERAVATAGGRSVHAGRRRDLSFDAGETADRLPGCAAVFLASPNNPTSDLVPGRDLLRLVERASETGTRVFLDETFIEFTDGESLASRVEEFPNLLVARSLTKFFALAGLRVGYGLASRRSADLLRRSKMPWSVGGLAASAAVGALRDRAYVERSRRWISGERGRLYAGLRKLPLEAPRPEANFVLLRLEGGRRAGELKSELLKRKILVRDCSSFRGLGQGYVRVCVRRRRENALLLEALGECI